MAKLSFQQTTKLVTERYWVTVTDNYVNSFVFNFLKIFVRCFVEEILKL